MKRSVPAMHICRFRGERVTDQKPPKRTRCEITDAETQKQCRSRAVAYVRFAWGGAALCEKHTKEETEP